MTRTNGSKDVTPELIDEMVKLYAEGNGFTRVATILGCNWQTVRNHLKERGVKIRPSHAREYWAKREIIREIVVINEVEVEVIREVIVEVPLPQPEAPPTPKRRIVGNNSKTYER